MNLPPPDDDSFFDPPPEEPFSRLLQRLRLPTEYHHECHIPTHTELQRAAVYALDEWTAFLVLNHDTPAIIAERLTDIADVVKAACAIDGDHRPKAIRLGLELDPRYWWDQGRADEMPDMVLLMLSTAMDLREQRLISNVYRMWSVYLYLSHNQPKSKKALELALEYATASGREDLALLASVEHFNLDIFEMDLAEAEIRAKPLLSQARQLNYTYAEGRVYLSLARACHHAALPHQTFMYAQQALAFFVSDNQPDIAGQAIDEMLGSLQQQTDHSPVYISHLFEYLETLMESSVNPWFQAAMYHHQAVYNHIQQSYDRARAYAIKAWLHYRDIRQKESCIIVVHMLGLIQTKRRRWSIAARHLIAAADFYKARNNAVMDVHAHHALAYIPVEKGDLKRARTELKKVLVMAKELPASGTQDRLVQLIQDDLDDVTRRLVKLT